jgi:tetratricopeptide (TPR) repeat protein
MALVYGRPTIHQSMDQFNSIFRELTMPRNELPEDSMVKIRELCTEGDRLLEIDDFDGALAKYREAWELVPTDKIEWEASTWILAASGEVYFRRRQYEESLNRFLRAVQCPKGIGNPYIHLRLGQLHFELGDLENAGDELTRAFMSEGARIFREEDPKYLSFILHILRPAANESRE